MKKVIWIDTETTGLNKNIHGLREVGYIIDIDGVELEKGLLHIDTGTYKNEKYISKYVKENMCIDEETLNTYPDSDEQFLKFNNVISRYVNIADKDDKFIVAGFNVDFDIGFMQEWFNDTQTKSKYSDYFGYQSLDVLALVRHFKYLDVLQTKNNKLETLCKHFGIEIDAHEALSDIEATKKLWNVLVKHIS